jgi:hypothetical protein
VLLRLGRLAEAETVSRELVDSIANRPYVDRR